MIKRDGGQRSNICEQLVKLEKIKTIRQGKE